MKTFSEKVREGRLNLGLSQTELGNRIGVSLRTVASYETENARPRAKTLAKLASVLGVSVKYLSDTTCDDPNADIAIDNFVSHAREAFGGQGAKDVEKLLLENTALFAGGELNEAGKDAFFEAITKAYFAAKKAASETFGRKNKSSDN